MGYRPDRQRRRDWKRWVAKHREALLLAGVPEEVFSDEQRWRRLLEDGGDDHRSGWNADMLCDAEAGRLYRFLREHYRNADCHGLRWRLDARPGPIDR